VTRKVLFDSDPGCDDAVMLAMALGLDDVEVVGVSTVCGNTTVGNATRNALSVLELGGADVPVARGCGRPLVDELTTAEWVHGEGGIRGDVPDPAGDPVDAHGAEFIVEQAREHGSDLVVAAVGPLPNLATALALEPDLPEMVGDVYLMGGSAFAGGNATPAAEANFHNDPAAAERVLQDAAPRMVGLDVTNEATVPADVVAEYRAADGVRGVVGDWLDYPESVTATTGGAPAIHDAAVVADIADPGVLTFESYPAEVDVTGGPSHGAVVADRHGVTDADPNCEVAVDIDVERFRELLFAGVDAYAG
jgi:inosine-uridine nucleoside N-ribohydrolase